MTFSIFKTVNPFAKRWKRIDWLAVFFARYLPYLMVFFLVVFSVFVKNYSMLFFSLLSALFARFVINELIYLFYRRERPSVLKETKTLIPTPKNPSFPSGHASFFFGLSFLLVFYNTTLAVIFIFCTCLVAFFRVFSGVHRFRDILGGMVVGLISAILINLFNVGY